MKIFGWMHKLHLGTDQYHRFAHKNSVSDVHRRDEENSEVTSAASEKEEDTEAMLLHHVLLTIGTLGHHTPPPTPHLYEDDDQEYDPYHHPNILPFDDGTKFEEFNPPPNGTPFHQDHHSSTLDLHATSHEVAVILDGKLKQLVEVGVEEEIVSVEPLLKEDWSKPPEKRTTLAELFASEPLTAPVAVLVDTTKDTNSDKEKKKADNRKEKTVVSSSTPAARKIHRLIRGMVKKKIHPDTAARVDDNVRHPKHKKGDQGRRHDDHVHLIC